MHATLAPLFAFQPFGLPWLLVGELLALGVCAGFLAGLLGVGGGMFLAPFMTAILSYRGVPADMAVKMAIATSMATIVFTSASSVRAHHQHGAVLWPLVATLAPGIVIGSLLAGAGAFALLKGAVLALVFAGFLMLSATQMLVGRRETKVRPMPGPARRTVAGAVIGFVAGLVGAGGGFVSVPYMTGHGVSIHKAIATSAALGFPIALAAVTGYVISGWSMQAPLPGAVGYVFVPALLIIAVASMLMAPVGARLAHGLPVKLLRQLFALLLLALALYMLYKGLVSIRA